METGPFPDTRLTGDLYMLIGHPVAGLRSPVLLMQALEVRESDGLALALDIGTEGLADLIRVARRVENLRGMMVTMPHKESVVPLLDARDRAARVTGAVNMIRREADGRLVGAQLDGAGMLAALRAKGFDPEGRAVWMVGAGGVAAGIADTLAAAGAGSIRIANRNEARAEELVRRLVEAHPSCDTGSTSDRPGPEHDLVLNATSVGMDAEDAIPADCAAMRPDSVVACVINRPHKTAFLSQADAMGLMTVDGAEMVAGQIPLMIEFFDG